MSDSASSPVRRVSERRSVSKLQVKRNTFPQQRILPPQPLLTGVTTTPIEENEKNKDKKVSERMYLGRKQTGQNKTG